MLEIKYKEYIEQNGYNIDSSQLELIHKFEELSKTIQKENSAQGKILNFFSLLKKSKNKGIYIYGGVGKGKTTLMHIFFDNLQIKNKLFIHFHNFMQMVHNELQIIRKLNSDSHSIEEVAQKLAKDYQLICLDEFHIMDVTDAMILSKLIDALYKYNIFIITTSNRAPEDLYKQDYGKEHFQKFVKILTKNMETFNLDAPRDYRMSKIVNPKKSIFIGNYQEDEFKELSGIKYIKISSINLNVSGRILSLNNSYQRILYTNFIELCSSNLSQLDYIEICKYFDCVIMYKIPKMSDEMHNEAKRFIMLIDQLYVNKIKFIANLETSIEKLYESGSGSFEFDRTESRLYEMQSI